ncbi:MAG: CcoQ/FixQ family Cbb3-type cytochrome c oxidase assembly chaperone [Rhizobiales bacterium]|nr:CcoQ/FixQ family Cbb3-type cytochrome c oxidase assembly chaperone [Hyphomicrobiales bacterium]
MSTYLALAHFAQTWGLVYFVTVFVSVLTYVLWPSRKSMYDAAARVPLRED